MAGSNTAGSNTTRANVAASTRGLGERSVMATAVVADARLVAEVLEGGPDGSAGPQVGGRDTGSTGAAILATRQLAVLVDDILDALVHQARDEGASWARIGELLHVTRQAAFARFATPARGRPGLTADRCAVPDERVAGRLAGHAVGVLGDVLARRWEPVAEHLDERTAQRLSRHAFEALVDRTTARLGTPAGFGLPTARVHGGYVVVDVPVTLSRGSVTGRVTYDRDERIAGLFLLDPRTEVTS